MGRKPQPSKKPVPDFLVGQNRGVNPRGIPYDRDINDQMESLKNVGQFAWESLPGIGTAYTIQDIKDELAKEDPNYYMIGALAGAEVIGLIPGLGDAAAELIKKGAKSAGKLGSKIDRTVDQTTALLGGPKAKDVIKNEMAGFTGQNPPTYKKRDTPLSQQEDFEPDFNEDGVIKPKGIPSEKTRLRKDNIMQFREPIAEFAKTVTIPKKGLLGSEFLKMIKKNESIADSSLQPQIIDPKKRYTREELLEAIGLQDQYPGPNVFESNAFINNTMGGEMYAAYQRQGKDAGFLDIEKELGYFEIPIVSNVPSGFAGTGKNFKANSQHFTAGTIAHVRGSIVQPHNLEESGFIGTNVSAEYERLTDFGKKPFLLVEEIQSDLLQKGYAKPSSLSDAAFNKVTEEWSRDNYVSFQEAFGDISKDIQSIFEELDEANMVRPDLVDGFGARNKFQRDTANRGYVLLDELEETLDKLNVSPNEIGQYTGNLLDMQPGFYPIIDANTGLEVSIADFLEKFQKETYVSPKDKTQKFFDKSRELLANKKIDKEIEFADFQNLYERYKTNQFRLSRGGYHQDIGLPPITKNKQAVEESLKTLIAKAAQSDVDKIVIPPAERIAYARGRDINPNNKGDRFYRTYVSDLDKALKDLEKNYPVKVHRDVELPYESKERMIEESEATANFYEVATDFLRQNLIEHDGISVPRDIDLEALNRAADKERFFSPLSAEEDAAFRAFAKHNQISLDEAGDAFDSWFDGQLRHLQGVDGFDEIQESLSTQVSNKGIILDISELVDKYKVEAPRQFDKGGYLRPKLRPEGFPKLSSSPKPRLRPSEDEVRYVDAVFRGEDGDIITSPEENNPVTMLGLTDGDTFRQYPNNNLSVYGAYLKPSDIAEGGPHKSKLQEFYAREKPDSPPLLINDILIAGEEGVKNRYTAAHEFMHRGFNVLRNNHNFDEVSKRFGRATAQILFHSEKDDFLEHALVQTILEKEGEIAGIDYTSKDYLKGVSKETRDKLKKSVEDIYELSNETLGEAGYQTDRDRGPTTRQGRRGAKPKSFWSFITEKLGFAEGGSVEAEWDLSSKEYDGKEINVITFKDGKELTMDQIKYMFEKHKSASEPIPGPTTSKEILNFLKKNNPTRDEFIQHFSAKRLNKGGFNMNRQMELFARGGLRDDGMDMDPVSGNEVPSGSLAEEVRDDIPAQLSEGEYVVPADVVRYYGVKFFEDLRAEAKMGLTRMEADGRIGGEPVEDDLSPQEMALLQEVMAAEQPIGMNEGGLAPYKNEDYIFSPTLPNPALSVPGMSYMTPTTPQPFVQQPAPASTTPTPSVEYCESINMMYDPETKMCVPKPTVQQESDDGPTPTPTGEPGKSNAEYLNENLNFSDPDSIMVWAQGLSEPMKNEKLIKGAGLLMGGPGAILAGGVTAGDALKDISDLRAAAIIARARGDDDLAKNLDNLVEKRIKASSGIVDILDDLVATGQQKAEGYAKYLGFESLEDMSKPENQERLKARTRKYTVKDLKQDQEERERVQAMSRQQAEAAGIDTGGGDDDNNLWEQFKPAATGTATVVDSDGSSRTVTTYNVDKVKEQAKLGTPGGKARGGLMQKKKRTKNPKK